MAAKNSIKKGGASPKVTPAKGYAKKERVQALNETVTKLTGKGTSPVKGTSPGKGYAKRKRVDALNDTVLALTGKVQQLVSHANAVAAGTGANQKTKKLSPLHCVLGPWTAVSTCSKNCGGGVRRWKREPTGRLKTTKAVSKVSKTFLQLDTHDQHLKKHRPPPVKTGTAKPKNSTTAKNAAVLSAATRSAVRSTVELAEEAKSAVKSAEAKSPQKVRESKKAVVKAAVEPGDPGNGLIQAD